MANVRATGRFPAFRLKEGTAKKVGEVVFSALERQAAAGLAPAKRGGLVTLHEVGEGSIWRQVTIDSDGTIHFESAIAFLLDKYDARALKGSFLDEARQWLFQLLRDSLEVDRG